MTIDFRHFTKRVCKLPEKKSTFLYKLPEIVY